MESVDSTGPIDGIAIIGMSGRFPKASGLDEFWVNLRDGVEAITPLSDEDLLATGLQPEALQNPRLVKCASYLDGIEEFDASFFEISAAEAEIMDPQHRIFLECAWEALESAGYAVESYDGWIGVYAGASMNSYLLRNLYSNYAEISASVGDLALLLANAQDHLPTRVSYKLNLRGPSVNIQTACSTSLVAVQVACQGLQTYQCDIALAGGVSITVPQRVGYWYQENSVASPDGHCRAFDMAAQGTMFGDGVGVVVLKRLGDALADGDPIHAIIRGAAINNDGAHKVGYAAPSISGQANVIAAAQTFAGIDPETITYVEAHGTATALGDPIEVLALAQAFRMHTSKIGFCALGSVKTNIGHLDAAAGVAGLIKTVLALKHKQIPPSLNFTQPNPKIDFVSSPFFVNTKLREWTTDGTTPRRAGVSSFGIGGTNAHVILEEALDQQRSDPARPLQLLTVSAKTQVSLDAVTQYLAAHLAQFPDVALADVAYTLHVGRKEFPYRRAVVCGDTLAAVDALVAAPSLAVSRQYESGNQSVAFMFPKDGVDSVHMMADLYHAHAIVREVIDTCSTVLEPRLGLNVAAILASSSKSASSMPPHVAQSTLFVAEYALAQLWIHWGIRATALIGYGIGNWVAACLAGICELTEALDIIAAYGRLLAVQHATTHKEFLVASFAQHVSQARLKVPALPMISHATGIWLTEQEATDPHYWIAQLSQSGPRGPGLQTIMQEPSPILLEVGPRSTLATLLHDEPQLDPSCLLTSGWSPGQNSIDEAVLHALGIAWSAGVAVDWRQFHAGERRNRVTLPTYAFDRQCYWISPKQIDVSAELPLEKKADIADWFYVPTWKRVPLLTEATSLVEEETWLIFVDNGDVSERTVQWLQEHGQRVSIVSPGAGFAVSGHGRYTLDPSMPEHYTLLLRSLIKEERWPRRILYFWSITESDASLQVVQERCLFSLLWLIQAVGRQAETEPLHLSVVANDLYLVENTDRVTPEKALLLGMCKVIPLEYPYISCQSIDLYPHENVLALEMLIAECVHKSKSKEVAYRGRHRWVPSYEPLRLPNPEAPPVRPGGVYLITGGLGGLGLALAEYLAATAEAKLVLVQRRPFPAPASWTAWLDSHDAAEETSQIISRLQALESYGAEVLIAQADVSNAEQMRAVLGQAEARFGRLHGVIHAAGVPGGGLIQLKTAEAVAEVLAAKVGGTRVLEHLLAHTPLDFLVLFSSTHALLGDFGLADYCAANAFLDSFTYHAMTSRLPTPVITINWDVWAETGMTVQVDVPELFRAQHQERMYLGMSTAEGVRAFVLAIGGLQPQIIVSTQDLELRVQQGRDSALNGNASLSNSHVGPATRAMMSVDYVAPHTDLQYVICDIWREMLGIDYIGILDNYFDLGGHSLMAIRIVAKIRDILQVIIPVESLFDTPTVEKLADLILTIDGESGRVNRIAAIYRKLSSMSPDEVQASLYGKKVRDT